MSELTYVVPKVGEAVTLAEPLVDTALTNIKEVVNGKIAAVNLEANAVETAKIKAEAVTGPKLGAETMRILAAAKYSAGKAYVSETEEEPSATRPAFVTLMAISGNLQNVTVGGIALGPSVVGGTTFASFLVPSAVKWKAKTSGESQWSALLL